MKITTNVIASCPPLRTLRTKDKNALQVSAISKYGESRWYFTSEIPNKNLNTADKTIAWDNIKFSDGTKLTDTKHEALLESAKDFVFCLLFSPSRSRSSIKFITVVGKARCLKKVILWMATKHYYRFSELNRAACKDFTSYVRLLPLAKRTQAGILGVLIDLYNQKHLLKDVITEHPFNYESANNVVGYSLSDVEKNKTLRIPEVVLMDLIGKSLTYIETEAAGIIQMQNEYRELNEQIKNRSRDFQSGRRKMFCQLRGLSRVQDFKNNINNLYTACYIIIAFFSGMRDSEIISIKEGCVKKKLRNNDNPIYIIHSVTYKMHDQPKPEKWMVPQVVKTTVNALSSLTKSLRKKSGLKELFLNEHDGRVSGMTNRMINYYLKKFVKDNNVALYKNKKWHLHSHQFRRSFAYYMMKENKCNLKFLQMQFKHLSMDMTLWYSETGDDDLKQDVYSMSVEVTQDILRPILLDTANLAGKGGEHIAKNRETYFSGKTAREKESLIKELISDLYVRSTYLGLCVWNPEKAKCEAGFECRCNPNICTNAVVTTEHLPLWIHFKERHEKLLSTPNIEPMKKQFIQTQLDTFVMPILNKLQQRG